jgi:hypothetical protein
MPTSYHNTTDSTGSELRDYEDKAKGQDELIMEFFMQNSGGFTPSFIQQKVLPQAPITSVRRAMTNLTNRGKLRKTELQVQGPYGRPEYVWKRQPVQLSLIGEG